MFTYILSRKIKRMEAAYKSAQQHQVIIICNNIMNTSIKYLGLSIFMYYTFQERKVKVTLPIYSRFQWVCLQ